VSCDEPGGPEGLAEKRGFDSHPLLQNVFPSGRKAITHTLRLLGLKRWHLVGIPEWSSHCVISAVGHVATPVPMNVITQYGVKIDALIVYEQWGWPFSSETSLEQFKGIPIIHDRVYSVDMNTLYPIEIFSLSKALGFMAGGLIWMDGRFLTFDKGLNPKLKGWFVENLLSQAMKREYRERILTLNTVRDSSWPEWMQSPNIAPAFVPMFRGLSRIELQREKTFVEGSEVYHFNWSGDPVNTQYAECLMVPNRRI